MPYLRLPKTKSTTSGGYTQVVNHAALPAAAANSGKIYIVETSTGIWPVRKSSGFWMSNGTTWVYLGDLDPTYIKNLYESNSDTNAFTNSYKTQVDSNTSLRHNAVTLGTANGLSLTIQALSLATASQSTTGALSSTDFTTFNAKASVDQAIIFSMIFG